MIRGLFKGLFLLVLLLIVGAASGLGALYLFRGGEGVFLPQVEGRDVVEALELLGERNIPLQVTGRAFSDKVPQNHVMRQSPSGG